MELFAKLAHKVAKSKKFKLNRNPQKIPIMYNRTMLCHRFSNEWWWWWWGGGGGGGVALNHLSLIFCKSVYLLDV